jgi:hypothetical protein
MDQLFALGHVCTGTKVPELATGSGNTLTLAQSSIYVSQE